MWEETPFLTHPGAGKGWVTATTCPLRGYSMANKKGGANRADRASSRTCSRALRSYTFKYADSRREDLFPQVKSKLQVCERGVQVCERGVNGQSSLCGSTSLFYRSHVAWRPASSRRADTHLTGHLQDPAQARQGQVRARCGARLEDGVPMAGGCPLFAWHCDGQ